MDTLRQPGPDGHGRVIGTLDCYSSLPDERGTGRHVDLWCPPSYAAGSSRHPVIYAHDGQNLFESTHAFGGTSWAMDHAIVGLSDAGLIRAPIVVALWNGPLRWRDYMPQAPLEEPGATAEARRFEQVTGGPPVSDAHVRFLVDRVKPMVDGLYRTLPDRANTFAMGSSMGGLISLYALQQYPSVFGGAACLSTHWPAGGTQLVDWLASHLPPPVGHRLYFDYGTLGLDAEYEPLQTRFDAILRQRGWREGYDWDTLRFDGADHSEAAWRVRLPVPLMFLLGMNRPTPEQDARGQAAEEGR